MSQTINNYTLQETLFSNDRTLIQRAIRESDGTRVILKSLVASYPTLAQLRRFSFAYEVVKKFDHPNIIKVLDYIEQGNVPVMVLEDQQSIDIRQYTGQQTNKRLSVDKFLTVAIQLADALSVIHHAQVIHKDLHPGNIIIHPETLHAQIIDFGLSSILSREQPSLAAPDKLEGVLAYISPEQTGRMNRTLDYRTDFYTLGVTFYELLTGQVPFRAEDSLGMVHAHIAKNQKPVIKICKEIPEVISKLIDKLLNKVAEERYQSAQGLKTDLEKCLKALKDDKAPQSFSLGEGDVSDRFQIPQKLYGRETEINTLLTHFNKTSYGAPQLLSVCGYSGIGKSALMNEVHKPIAEHNGLFLSGKFDQFQRNIPYSAFYQVLKSWLLKVLSLSEHLLQVQREQLNETLGVNARVMIDFMPEFKPLLGELAEVPKLGADETQNRFHIVFLKLITFIAEDRPLVICIDDLQWADRGSLNLLPLLMREADCSLLIIVAYRDNEVDDTHPAIHTLNIIRENDADSISSLSLGPLSLNDVQQLLIDSLHHGAKEVQSLSELVHHKTGGNPFFVNEFLKTLYSEELLNFDLAQRCWQWDIAAITAKGISDNVVELMLGKMQQLPSNTQQLLQLASCIGSRFDIELLAIVAEQKESEITQILWPALKEGLLLQSGAMNTQNAFVLAQCKFLHDRMLQAAYESMSIVQREQIHLKIGRLLRNSYLQDNQTFQWSQSSSLFAIVEQLNQGRSLISDDVERLHLVELNQKAADQAKAASAWEAVVQYASIGMGLLPKDSWKTCYQLTFDLYSVKAEGEYLCGRPDTSNDLYDELLKYCHEDLLRAEICVTRLVESIGRGRWKLGIKFGLQGLGYLNIPFTSDDDEVNEALLQEQILFDEQIKNTRISQIIELPEMSNQGLLIAMKILTNLNACAFLLGDLIILELGILRGLNFILKGGKSDLTVVQLSWYAVFLAQRGEYEQSTKVVEQIHKLKAHYPHVRELASTYNILSGLVLPFKESYDYCIAQHQKGYEIGLESGEIARAVIGLNNILFLKFSKGDRLKLVQEQADYSIKISRRKAVFVPHGNNIPKLVKALMESGESGSEALDESAFSTAYLNKIKGSLHEYNLLHYRSELAFWYGDQQKSLGISRFTHDRQSGTSKFSCYTDHLIQYGLLLVSTGNQGVNDSDDFEFCLQELKKLSQFCPANFDHKYQLLLAEQGRYQNNSMMQVTEHYKKSITSAKENGFLQYQALANELLALYWKSKGLESAATAYLEEAIYLYECWGCMARVVYLKKNYGQLLAYSSMDVDQASSTKLSRDTSLGSISSIGSPFVSGIQSQYLTNTPEGLKTNSQDKSGLDFDSIMKSSQLISSELKLKQLALKVMKVITESAGAQTAALVLNTVEGVRVEARVSVQSESSETITSPAVSSNNIKSQMLDECTDLPLSIISYVLRTDETVNLANVDDNKDFENDPYLKGQPPQSILCVPVLYRGKVIGALYLENRLTPKAFTKKRLNVIKMLLLQTAISIENARLFEEINLLNEELEQKVVERTEQLSGSNTALKAANDELNAFSYSVSHDLRSPLRSMKGFSQILLAEYTDKLDSMGVSLLERIMSGSSKMGELINGLLELSRVQNQDVELNPVNLSEMAKSIVLELNEHTVDRTVEFTCAQDIEVQGDQRMLASVMGNLLNNAWKYSSKATQAQVEFGREQQNDQTVYFVKDNGAGFDMEKSDKLFGTFQRLHSEKEFTGTGIGLATVKRIINKHKGDIWAKAEKGKGATFYFTL